MKGTCEFDDLEVSADQLAQLPQLMRRLFPQVLREVLATDIDEIDTDSQEFRREFPRVSAKVFREVFPSVIAAEVNASLNRLRGRVD